jgi:hypothetical protein
MRSEALLRALFILYCFEAGMFLVIVPWTLAWDRNFVQVPATWLRGLLLEPTLRGAVSGFGLVHLVWGAHDLETWIAQRRARA